MRIHMFMLATILVASADANAAPGAQPNAFEVPNEQPDGLLVVPELKIAASTASEAEAMIDGNIAFAMGDLVDAQVAPFAKIKTRNGLGGLFSASGDETNLPWRFGLALKVMFYPDGTIFAFEEARKDEEAIGDHASLICKQECTSSSDESSGCKKFLEALAAAGQRTNIVDVENQCVAGLRYYANNTRSPRILFPPTSLSIGFAYGEDRYTYIDNTDAADSKLVEDEKHRAWRVAALMTHVWSRWATLEYSAQFGHDVTPMRKKARFCRDKGVVINGVADSSPDRPADDVNDSKVEQCREEALGAPSEGFVLVPWVEYGIVDTPGSRWRLSMGPRVQVRFTEEDVRFESLQFRVPFAFAPASLPKEVSSDVKGIVRIVPYIENALAKDDAGKDVREWRFAVNLEVLAQRSLFATVAPEL